MAEKERVENCQKACLAAGVNTITSLDQGSAEARFCKEWYEEIVEAELSLYKWRHSTKSVEMNLLNVTPDSKFNNAWQLPNDVLSIDTVMVGGSPIEYDRHGDQIHTEDRSNDTVVVQYRFRSDESVWSPYFRLLVIYRLATMLSFSIARRDDVAASMKGLADEHWRRAKTEDAQSKTNQKANLSRLRRARGGALDKFWRNR